MLQQQEIAETDWTDTIQNCLCDDSDVVHCFEFQHNKLTDYRGASLMFSVVKGACDQPVQGSLHFRSWRVTRLETLGSIQAFTFMVATIIIGQTKIRLLL